MDWGAIVVYLLGGLMPPQLIHGIAERGGIEWRIASLSLPDIAAGVTRSRGKLKSLQAQYIFRPTYPISGEARGRYLRVEITARGTARKVKIVHSDFGMPESLDMHVNEVYYTGQELNVFYPNGAYYEVSKRNASRPYAWPERAEFFLVCLGWWPPEDSSTPPGDPGFFLHEALQRPNYKVLRLQQLVDGVWCHVVECPGKDQIWLDPAAGFAMRHRKCFSGDPPILTQLIRARDFREIEAGVWLPFSFERVAYDTSRCDESGAPVVEAAARCFLVKAESNNVRDEDFHFSPPAGSLVQNRDTGEMWQIPGGLEVLDRIISIAQGRLEVYAKLRTESTPSPALPWGKQIHAGLVVVAVLALIDLFIIRKWIRQLSCQQ
jgi:hypothetical protein